MIKKKKKTRIRSKNGRRGISTNKFLPVSKNWPSFASRYNKIGELIVHPSMDGGDGAKRREIRLDPKAIVYLRWVDRGVESTPSDKRTLLHSTLHNEETAPGSRAAFDLSLRPDRAWQGGSSRQKIYEPLGNPSMLLLILSSSVYSTVHKKNAGVVCTRQPSSKRNL